MTIITTNNFNSEVAAFKGKVLIDFWAAWCGPCKMLAPVIEEIDNEAIIKTAKLNVDDSGEIAEKYNVSSIPTVVLFEDGKEIARSVGFKNKAALLKSLGL